MIAVAALVASFVAIYKAGVHRGRQLKDTEDWATFQTTLNNPILRWQMTQTVERLDRERTAAELAQIDLEADG